MEFLADGLSAIATLFSVAMVLAGVMKLFQIHTALTEIKDVLQNGARPAAMPQPVAYAPAPQPAYTPAPQQTYAPMGPVSKTPPAAPPPQAAVPHAELYAMGSGEAMLRALDLQMKAEDGPGLTPEVVDPRR
jgi:hypothetical protein